MKTLLLAFVIVAPVPSIGQPLPPVQDSPASITDYEYDAEGRMTRAVRGSGTLDLSTRLSRDASGNIEAITDPAQGSTRLRHDAVGRPLQVIDPRNLTTRYERDGWGRITKIISPDSGTAEFRYDAHDLIGSVDGRGVTGQFEHDWQHRPTLARYRYGGQPDVVLRWAWDETGPLAGFGHGSLTSTSFPAGVARYRYGEGRELATITQSLEATPGAHVVPLIHITEYGHSQTRLTSITYPSGRRLHITWNAGRIEAMGLAERADTQPTPLISQVIWEPFATAVRGWTWETAIGPIRHERVRDLGGRLVRYPLGDVVRDLRYDEADRIVSFTHLMRDGVAQPALDQQFSFDANDRLTGIVTAAASWRIVHDPNGNRTLLSLNGNLSIFEVDATSNRLLGTSNPATRLMHDASGNTTSVSTAGRALTATYDLVGQVSTLTRDGVTTSYAYDALGQRIRKSSSRGPADTVVFVYDPEGHLLGEYDHTGAPLREYIWLRDTPVAVFMPDPANPAGAPQMFYIHADHIDTPRVVLDVNNRVRWRWWAEPFGTTAPETNPQGLGNFTFNLRFPGQYADGESGLFYNGFRYYSPQGERYAQSDPIGLLGGANTFTYGENNPLSNVDPYGLWSMADLPSLPQGVVDFSAGMGDVVLFGQGQRLRDFADVDGGIDKCSGEYSAGEWAGVGVGVATGIAGGIRAAGARGAGKEFSHWIPNRMGGSRSIMNGNYVSGETHALSDPFRYRFMPREWKAANPMPSKATQQWVRFPNVYKGAGTGIAYGAGGAAANDCTCPR